VPTSVEHGAGGGGGGKTDASIIAVLQAHRRDRNGDRRDHARSPFSFLQSPDIPSFAKHLRHVSRPFRLVCSIRELC
jgi:hypothetical protein